GDADGQPSDAPQRVDLVVYVTPAVLAGTASPAAYSVVYAGPRGAGVTAAYEGTEMVLRDLDTGDELGRYDVAAPVVGAIEAARDGAVQTIGEAQTEATSAVGALVTQAAIDGAAAGAAAGQTAGAEAGTTAGAASGGAA